jgi:hypothetical protein
VLLVMYLLLLVERLHGVILSEMATAWRWSRTHLIDRVDALTLDEHSEQLIHPVVCVTAIETNRVLSLARVW